MRTAALPFLAGLLLSSSLGAQTATTSCETGSIALRQLCLETLPPSGYITLSDGEGGKQRCPCQDLLHASVAEMDSLRKARDKTYGERAMRRRAPDADPDTPTSYAFIIGPTFDTLGEGTAMREDTAVYLDDLARCLKERRLETILHRIANLEGIGMGLTNRFQVTVVYGADAQDARFMSITAHETEGWFQIVVPAPLLCAASITGEVLAFMILHEMGHVFGDEGDDPYALASEFAADHWATAVGIPAFFDDTSAPQVRTRVAAGYEAYHALIFNVATAGNSTCGHRGINHYPKLDCRKHGIIDPLWSGPDGRLLLEFPDPCWASCATGEDRMVLNTTHTWDENTCCPPKPEPRVCFLPESICYEVERLGVMVEGLVKPKQVIVPHICDLHPELCDRIRVQQSFDGMVRRPVKREQRIVKQIQQATEELRELEEDLIHER